MDRDKCLYFLRKAHGLDTKQGLTQEEIVEILTDYVCDRGFCEKKDYLPILMTIVGWERLINCAFDYYRTLFNINMIRLSDTPNEYGISDGRVISFY